MHFLLLLPLPNFPPLIPVKMSSNTFFFSKVTILWEKKQRVSIAIGDIA